MTGAVTEYSEILRDGKRCAVEFRSIESLDGPLSMKGEEIPLTPPMLAIAAAGDAADEDNAAAHEAAGSSAEAHPGPHSPPVSPVRELTPERQPETEWVVPNPVSPVADWRPWPSVPAHSPIRDSTHEPASPPNPPTQTFIFEEPLAFGPEPRPAGYVDPDDIDSIIFGPQPRPSDFVDPTFVEPSIFGPQPRPDNYREPEDLDNPMEDDTTHDGFHVASPGGPNDAPTPTAAAAGRAEDPTLLTSLSAKLDRCLGRIDSLETELGTSKKIMGGAILTLVSRVKKLERTVKQLKTARFVGDAPATEGDVTIQDDVDLAGLSRMASEALGHDQPAVPSEDIEEREEEEFHAPLSTDVLPQADISESAGPSVGADKGKAPMPDLEIPAEFLAEDAQARQRLEEEQASERLVQQLQTEALVQADLPPVSEERAKELDELMMRMTETDWLNLMMQVGSNPALARELLGADVTEDNFIERMTAIKERKKGRVNRQRLEKDRLLSAQYNLFRPKPVITEPPSKRQRVNRASSQPSHVPAATTQPADDHDSAGGSSFHPAGSAPPFFGSAAPTSAGGVFDVPDSTVPTSAAMDSAGSHRGINDFFLPSNADAQIGLSRVAVDPDSDDEVLAEILFRGISTEPRCRCGLDLWKTVNRLSVHHSDMWKIFGEHKRTGCEIIWKLVLALTTNGFHTTMASQPKPRVLAHIAKRLFGLTQIFDGLPRINTLEVMRKLQFYDLVDILVNVCCCCIDCKLLIQDFAASFDSAVHRVHDGSFDAAVVFLVSALV
ncbi:hypothetical protein Tco_0551162 [Tanacetum coccineum]